MKKSILLFGISILAVSAATTHAGVVSAQIHLSRAPALSSTGSRAVYRPNAVTGTELGIAVGVGETAFRPIPNDYVANPSEVISYQNNTPRFEFSGHVVFDQPTSASRLSFRVTSNDPSTLSPNGAAVGGSLGSNYTTTRPGILYGNDRRKETADDPSRLVGGEASTTPVDEFVALSYGFQYDAATAEVAEQRRAYIVSKNLSVTYELLFDGVPIRSRTLRFGPIPPTPNPAPIVALTVNNLTGTITVTPGTTLVFQWNTQNANSVTGPLGGAVTSAGSATTTATQTATYTVTGVGAGGTGSASVTVIVAPNPSPAVVADFTASPVTGQAPQFSVQLNDRSKNGPISSWIWNFGNGTSSTLQNPVAIYSSTGTYSVTLTVTGSNGTTGTITQFIAVTGPAPQPPPQATFILAATTDLNKVGTVAPGEALAAFLTITNRGTGAYIGTIAYRWQYMVEGNVWTDWKANDGTLFGSGTLVNLLAGESKKVTLNWNAGGVDGNIFHIRAIFVASDGEHISDELRVMSTAASGQNTAQGVLKLIPAFSGTPGIYDFQKSTDLIHWVTLQTFDSRGGIPLVILPPGTFDGPVGFFRIIKK